jgi:hypothetical protein
MSGKGVTQFLEKSWILGWAFLFAGSGCSSGGKADGTQGAACYANGTCNAGLACVGGVCTTGLPGPDAAAAVPDVSPGGAEDLVPNPADGTQGAACYANGTCNAGLACVGGVCTTGLAGPDAATAAPDVSPGGAADLAPNPAQGTAGEACYPNGTCNAGLACVAGICAIGAGGAIPFSDEFGTWDATRWQGEEWCGNGDMGSWKPTIGSGGAKMWIDDYCWGQMRTVTKWQAGSSFEVDLTPFLQSGGTNRDEGFIALGTDWINYGTGAAVGLRLYGGAAFLWTSSSGDVRQLGTYTPGQPVAVIFRWNSTGTLEVSGSLGTGTVSAPALLQSSLSLLIAEKDSADGFLLNRACVGAACTIAVPGPDAAAAIPDASSGGATDLVVGDADDNSFGDQPPNLRTCQGDTASGVSTSYPLSASAIQVIQTVASGKGYSNTAGADYIQYTTVWNDTVYVRTVPALIADGGTDKEEDPAADAGVPSGTIVVASPCPLDSIGQVKRLENELVEALGFVAIAVPNASAGSITSALCDPGNVSFYGDGTFQYRRAYLPVDYGNMGGYLTVPSGTTVTNDINVCGYNKQANLTFTWAIDGTTVLNASAPGGQAGEQFVYYHPFPQLKGGTHSFKIDNYQFGCFLGCDGSVAIYIGALFAGSTDPMAMTNNDTHVVGDSLVSKPLSALQIP